MTTARPTTIDDLAALVPSRARWHVRAGGTKPALSTPPPGIDELNLAGLTGITEYSPEECTFTALAGTRLADVQDALAPHGQYLPFDPPFAPAGATLGGTVAAGVSGPGRLRFGGVRDFLIGVRFVDGDGHVRRSGGKVVKNAAGFLLHQALVGSAGRFAVLAELTFKVFPAPEASATVAIAMGSVADAVALMLTVQRERFDVDAMDITPPGTLFVRLSGFAEALPARLERLQRLAGISAHVLTGSDDVSMWRAAREFEWIEGSAALVRVPIAGSQLRRLDEALDAHGVRRRYSVAGNVAWIAWTLPLDTLDALLRDLGLGGQVLIAPTPLRSPLIGIVTPGAFDERVRTVLDPHRRFAG